jgi:hypothetical protein
VENTELTLQLVDVLILIMKMLLPVVVNHVPKNVSPVPLPPTVLSVLKTESTHQFVTVHLECMTVVLLNAYHVTGDVLLVNTNQKTVFHVSISELQLQNVHVQPHTMKTENYNPVKTVPQSVLGVLILHITVVDVCLTESTHQLVNVQPDISET